MAADDKEFTEFAVRFPEAVAALVGLPAGVRYRAEALEVKAMSGRFDAVLTAGSSGAPPSSADDDIVMTSDAPGGPRAYVEHQARHDRTLDRRFLLKIVTHCEQTGHFSPVRALILYADRRFAEGVDLADVRDEETTCVGFNPTRRVLTDLDPSVLDGAGWSGWILQPLLGSTSDVEAHAAAWYARLAADPGHAPDERAKGLDFFTRFVAGRVPDRQVYALLQIEEAVMEDTLTGRTLIARGEARGEARGLRLAITAVLEAKGRQAPADLVERLTRESDPVRLETILTATRALTPEADVGTIFDGV